MFKIRTEQKDAFQAEAMLDFEDRMVAHVERCLPERAATLGDVELRARIRLGIERAASVGFVAERDVCRFIDLMLVFGSEFDRNCPWAAEILEGRTADDPLGTIHALFERGLEQL
jgi:hypothetical protein